MPAEPKSREPLLAKVIIAPDVAQEAPPPSTPYRTTDAFEAIVALEAVKRENARLRSARKRSKVGVILALAASCASLAVFSTVLVLRHVPSDAALVPPVATCVPTPAEPAIAIDDPSLMPPRVTEVPTSETPSALDELGGEAALKPLAREITSALLADPVLQRNPRIAAVGRARLETAVRQQLIFLLDGTAEADVVDVAELMWDIRPTHAEWEAASDILDKALEKHKVSEDNRSSVASTVSSNESSAVDDITVRANALTLRASVGLPCAEGSISSRPLETSDARLVTGCGKRAIYAYVADANTGISAWHREPSP